jgi:hypothetical protein
MDSTKKRQVNLRSRFFDVIFVSVFYFIHIKIKPNLVLQPVNSCHNNLLVRVANFFINLEAALNQQQGKVALRLWQRSPVFPHFNNCVWTKMHSKDWCELVICRISISSWGNKLDLVAKSELVKFILLFTVLKIPQRFLEFSSLKVC